MKRTLKPVSSLSFVLVAALAWWLLAPPQLGGKTSYAVIYGISMEPHFHRGDLVLLRQEPSYHVGEIVGYHSNKLGKPVLHRIIRYENGHFWFKGDNNNFVDPEHPTADQLFGKEWVRLPGFGGRLEQLHEPRNAAILAAAAAFFVLMGGGISAQRRRRRRQGPSLPVPDASRGVLPTAPPRPKPAQRPLASEQAGGGWLMPAAATLGAIGVAGVVATSIFAIVAYTRPLATVQTQSDLYVQHGKFDYSANVPVGAVYDHSPAGPGDALFLKLVRSFAVQFRYRVATADHASLSGQASMDAVLTDGSGWRRQLALTPSRPFSGNGVELAGVVNLAAISRMISRFQAVTDQTQSTSYQIVVKPHVTLHGIVGSTMVNEAFNPPLAFELVAGRVRLAGTADGAPGNSLDRSRSGTGTKTTPQRLGSMGVSEARHIALIGVPGTIVLALLGGLLFLIARGNDEVALIRRRYGAWMIDVEATPRPPHLERRVESMDALARIAERYERLILHEQRARMHSFLVEDDGLVYRYDAHEKMNWRSNGGEGGAEAPTAPVGADETRAG